MKSTCDNFSLMTTEPNGEINHVSDTALMVAACRAHETSLDDAYFHDPFAERLAGERGLAILNAMPHANILRIGLAIRTRFIDDLLIDALSHNAIATVLSVGCGLDTRPWRLELPRDLRWVEVDFPDILDYKEQHMVGAMPRCRRERLSVDLNDPAQRRVMYEAAGASPALMITEGLLMYLSAATIDALASETATNTNVAHWIVDITTSTFSKVLGGGADTNKPIRQVQAPDALPGDKILEVLNSHGWKTSAMRSYIRDVGFVLDRVRRQSGGAEPPQLPFPPDDPTGIHHLTRS